MANADEQTVDPRVADSFAQQPLMALIGARIVEAHDGRATIELPRNQTLTQQHGYTHAAVLAAIGDSACGYAAMTLAPQGRGVLTVEYKISLLAPGDGELFVAQAEVLRAGRRLSFAQATIHAEQDDARTLIATLSATIASIDESRHA